MYIACACGDPVENCADGERMVCASGRSPFDETNDTDDNTFLRNSPAVLFRPGHI